MRDRLTGTTTPRFEGDCSITPLGDLVTLLQKHAVFLSRSEGRQFHYAGHITGRFKKICTLPRERKCPADSRKEDPALSLSR